MQTTVAYPERLVLWMGGERQGMTDDQMAACDRMVRIPMVGQSDSLNLATATAVLLYEVFNQRRRATSPPNPLPCGAREGEFTPGV